MKRLIIVGAMAVFVAACGADGSTAATTTVAPSITTVVTDTAASTTMPASTTSTPTTSTTTTTTLPEPTTTTVPTEALIKQAVQDYISAYFACGQAPAQCDPTTFTATQGPSRSIVTELATGMAKQGLYFSTDVRGSHVNPSLIQFANPAEATVESCWYDAGVVMGPLGPDGRPTVVNDETGSSTYLHTLYLEDGIWRVGQQIELENLGVQDTCGAEL